MMQDTHVAWMWKKIVSYKNQEIFGKCLLKINKIVEPPQLKRRATVGVYQVTKFSLDSVISLCHINYILCSKIRIVMLLQWLNRD